MIFSGEEERDWPEYDVAIIGSGPSGMTVFTELAASGLEVCVIETGSVAPSAFADKLRKIESEGIQVRENSRERIVGGTSKTWNGLSAPLDPIDFEKRPIPYHEGWPISYSDIEPYLEVAAQRYSFPAPSAFEPRMYVPSDAPFNPRWESLEEKILLKQPKPTHFGRKYKYVFEPAGLDLITDATVTSVVADGGVVRAARCVASNATRFEIRAKKFVLAAGGIETPRILLNSSIGNAYDQVGRYMMNHPKGYIGKIYFTKPVAADSFYFGGTHGYFVGYTGLRLRERVQKESGVLNAYLRLESEFPWSNRASIKHIRGSVSKLLALYRNIKSGAWRVIPRNIVSLIKEGFLALVYLPQLVWVGIISLPHVVRPGVRVARARCFLEMEPNPDNRVVLSDEKDAHGEKIARVVHATTERDIASLDSLLTSFAGECTKLGIGTFTRSPGNLVDLAGHDASHHMGATRMGRDPKTSVVDSDMRVHGIENLYITGGSVFPTSGNANPTYTMVALSIRLAKHLKNLFKVHASGKTATGKPILIFGAGRRITTDVIGVLEVLPDAFRITKVFARRPSALFTRNATYLVHPVAELSPRDIADTTYLYMAVPHVGIENALRTVTQHDCSHIELIIDTPAFPLDPKLYRAFKHVHVAEDSVTLPWLETVRAAKDSIGPIRSIIIDRSANRHHAISLVKALAGQVRFALKWGDRISISCRNGVRALVIEPRDYKKGTLTIRGQMQTLGDRARAGVVAIEPLCEKEYCTGFKIGNIETKLTPVESELVGRFGPEDTVITKMLELKRVGLYRMLARIGKGEVVWSLEAGLDDSRIDRAVRKFGFFGWTEG
ncbi:GMC family oxidoreductase [Candidatus Kaiserbacteria bacterium]|nr:GMC family oxidoreductase [Candidatus Kaiserbacteria bacterium]